MKSKEEIADIKTKLPISKLVSYYGAKSTTSKGLFYCFAHQDHNPSLLAKDDYGRANCMSPSCKIKSMDILDLIAAMEGCTFSEAVRKAKTIMGDNISENIKSTVDKPTLDPEKIPVLKHLKPKHIKWLNTRYKTGFDWILNDFKIQGYGWHHLAIPIDSKGESYVFIPLNKRDATNPKGDVTFYRGKYRSCQVFPNRPEIQVKAQFIFVCEGEKDVMRVSWELHRQGKLGEWAVITNTNGAVSVKEEISIFQNFDPNKVKAVIIAYDKDDAGQYANQIIYKMAKKYFNDKCFINIFDNFPIDAKRGYDISNLLDALPSNRLFCFNSLLPYELRDNGNQSLKKLTLFDALPSGYCMENPLERHSTLIESTDNINCDSPKTSVVVKRILNAAARIPMEEGNRNNIDFLHSVFCQVGMPRGKPKENLRVFERINGNVRIMLEAGYLPTPKGPVEQPLPYGTIPRLIMIYITGEAIKNNSPIVELGSSMTAFMKNIGLDNSGGQNGRHLHFKKQVDALAACRITLGMFDKETHHVVRTQPIDEFIVWLNANDREEILFPNVIKLSDKFFESLKKHSVPLNNIALVALKHSALSIDVYTWLANRLPRINTNENIFLSWNRLKEQFGQEYGDTSSFRKEFKQALNQVRAVYPNARISEKIDGRGYIRGYTFLYSSPSVLPYRV